MALTDSALRTLKVGPKARKVADEKGLYLELLPSGGKSWRLKYRLQGKENRICFGVYPEVSLKVARDRRDEARRLISEGIDPSAHRKALKRTAVDRAANDFETVAREWFSKFEPSWAESHSNRLLRRLERDIFPFVGGRPIADITPPELLTALRAVEDRTVDTAHRALRSTGQVFRYGIATGRCISDPSRDLKGALAANRGGGHFAATTEPKRLGQILALMDAYPGTPAVVAALKLTPLLFARPGELRRAEWQEIDLEGAQWEYISSKTKKLHVVPLSRQAIESLRHLHKVTGGGSKVFPGARSSARPMSENAVLVAMRSMEIGKDEMTGHGFRAVARTILDETMGFRPDIIEHQLAHSVKDPNGRAYNRTTHLEERRRMMQAWADHLDSLKPLPPNSCNVS